MKLFLLLIFLIHIIHFSFSLRFQNRNLALPRKNDINYDSLPSTTAKPRFNISDSLVSPILQENKPKSSAKVKTRSATLNDLGGEGNKKFMSQNLAITKAKTDPRYKINSKLTVNRKLEPETHSTTSLTNFSNSSSTEPTAETLTKTTPNSPAESISPDEHTLESINISAQSVDKSPEEGTINVSSDQVAVLDVDSNAVLQAEQSGQNEDMPFSVDPKVPEENYNNNENQNSSHFYSTGFVCPDGYTFDIYFGKCVRKIFDPNVKPYRK
jgi:hypothetical protein